MAIRATADGLRQGGGCEGPAQGQLIIDVDIEVLSLPGVEPVQIKADGAAVAIEAVGLPGILAIALGAIGKGAEKTGGSPRGRTAAVQPGGEQR